MFVDVIGGFLGSGKTTTILHLLRERAMDPAKTVLLVNEFGKVGVDGALLEGEGGAVRELASGCICCTLKADFMLQIEDIVATYAPEHVVVEPSGVASMRDVLQALTHPRVAHLISELRTVLVLDVDDYDWFVEMSDTFVDAQIGLAQLILLNKTDLAAAGSHRRGHRRPRAAQSRGRDRAHHLRRVLLGDGRAALGSRCRRPTVPRPGSRATSRSRRRSRDWWTVRPSGRSSRRSWRVASATCCGRRVSSTWAMGACGSTWLRIVCTRRRGPAAARAGSIW